MYCEYKRRQCFEKYESRTDCAHKAKYVIFFIPTTCRRKNAVGDVNVTPKIKRDFFRDRYTSEYCAKLFSSKMSLAEVDSTLENITRKCETTYVGITTSVYILRDTLAFLISGKKVPVTRGGDAGTGCRFRTISCPYV